MDEEVMEFGIAHASIRGTIFGTRKDDRLVIGISDYLAADIGEILRVILPHAETEVDERQNLFSIWTAEKEIDFPKSFCWTNCEINGEVEINPELGMIRLMT